MRDAEVIVVGGSLGGTAAARHLSALGHEVLILEKDTFPREKVCGEGLMPYGVAELVRLGVQLQGQAFHGIGYSIGGHRAVGRFPRGHSGLGVRRGRIDAAFAWGERRQLRVKTVTGEPGAMQVHTGQGVLRCSAVVGADGMRSGVRKALGLDRPARGRPRYGMRGHVQLAEGMKQLDTVEVLVEPAYELYLTPVGPRELNVAVLLEKDGTRSLKGDLAGGFARILQGVEIARGSTPVSKPMLTGPLRNESTRVWAPGAVLVGDAAGFLDGITGEGMSLTLVSARLAAEELSRALRSGGLHDLSAYARRRHRASRQQTWLTEIVLAGIRSRRLSKRVVRGLHKHPDVFERVLAVNAGVGSVRDVGLSGLWRVLAG